MIAGRLKVSGKGLAAKHRAMSQSLPEAATQAVQFSARHAVMWMVQNAPKDTNRYIRAWQMGMLGAGLGPVLVAPIKPGEFIRRAGVEGRLVRQLAFWRRQMQKEMQAKLYWHTIFENRYNRVGRKGRWRDDAMRRLKAAEWRSDRSAEIVRRIEAALDEVRNNPDAVVIFGRGSKAPVRSVPAGVSSIEDAKFARRLERAQFSLGQLTRVITTVYGGTGRIERSGTHVAIRLINLEPHARIVEKRHRLVQRSMAVAKTAGRMSGAQFTKKLKRGTGGKAA